MGDIENPCNQGRERDYIEPTPAPLFDKEELKRWSFYRAIIAELVATFLFLFISVSSIVNYKEPNYKESDKCGRLGILGVAWTFGGMIFVLVYCTSSVSGGHINPAVTFAMFVARKVSLIRALAYMVAQCVGALLAVMVVILFSGFADELQNSDGVVNQVLSGYSSGTALLAEIIGTFVLVYTVFSAIDPKRNARDSHVPVLAPLPIGFAVFVVHLALIPITGTSINPAKSLGTAVMYHDKKPLDELWIFWVGPLVGALVAAVYHQYILRAGGIQAVGSFRRSGSYPSSHSH